MEFKKKFSFEKRLEKSTDIMQKYPNRLPVIVELAKTLLSKELPPLKRHKFLVVQDMTLGQLIYIIRKNMELPPERAIFIFINEELHPTSQLMGNLYEKAKDEDGFLYLTVYPENTFG